MSAERRIEEAEVEIRDDLSNICKYQIITACTGQRDRSIERVESETGLQQTDLVVHTRPPIGGTDVHPRFTWLSRGFLNTINANSTRCR